jgi:hypothetical protein
MLSENSAMTAGITLPTASVVIAKVKNIKQTSARIIRPSNLSLLAGMVSRQTAATLREAGPNVARPVQVVAHGATARKLRRNP